MFLLGVAMPGGGILGACKGFMPLQGRLLFDWELAGRGGPDILGGGTPMGMLEFGGMRGEGVEVLRGGGCQGLGGMFGGGPWLCMGGAWEVIGLGMPGGGGMRLFCDMGGMRGGGPSPRGLGPELGGGWFWFCCCCHGGLKLCNQ